MTIKYESGFEEIIHTKYLPEFTVHPPCRDYITKHVYTPDLVRTVGGFEYIIEDKGYIYTGEGARKYVDFRTTLNKNQELIFIFQYPNKQLSWKRIRNNGTKMCLCEWAEYNKFRWFSEDNLFLLVKEIKDRQDG